MAIPTIAISKRNEGDPQPSGSGNSQVGSQGSEIEEPTGTDTETEPESESESETESEIAPPEPQGDGSELFVMFGVDSRSDKLGKGTRSDSIMLISVNHDAKQVKVVSIYRDCMLYQNYDGKEKGYKKISNAHSYYGPEGAISVLNENLDLNIENYCTVNFNAVGDLIDQVGGVEMDITSSEVKYINGYIDETNKVRGTNSPHITEPGTYTLDGTQAVAYSRIRYTAGSDYKRTERQRTVLFKVFEKSKSMSTSQRLNIVDKLLKEINTSYTQDELLVLIYYMSEYEISTMTAYPKVFYGGSVDGSWVEVPCTLVDMNIELHKILLSEDNYTPSERVKEISETLRNKVKGPNIDQRD
ncbi:MAG: LCP family protein [Agathobacter sp.]|nr:LCP family protein [Agathobacter sp.]